MQFNLIVAINKLTNLNLSETNQYIYNHNFINLQGIIQMAIIITAVNHFSKIILLLQTSVANFIIVKL